MRQQASRYLRAVERGQTIDISDRGCPVARLVPVGGGRPADRLVAEGRLVLATSDLFDLGEPLRPVPGRPRPSDVLARVRATER